MLAVLARLREVGRTALTGALQHGPDILASVFAADKLEAFPYDSSQELLVALGTSCTPQGRRQHELGLSRLSISRGGRAAPVFQDRSPCLESLAQAVLLARPVLRRQPGS